MDLQGLKDDSFCKTASTEIASAVSHQQLMNYRDVLERKLQQRTPREQLISQGIMPALATAPSLLSQKTKLERAKTGDYLQKKIRVRPNRAQLVQRHILNDVPQGVDPSLLANQMRLKRKKLEDDLNDRLALRPGPLELVKHNILEQGTAVGIAIQEGNIDYTETANSQLLEPISPESLDGSPEPSPDGTLITAQQPPTSIADFLNQSKSNISLFQGSSKLDGKRAEESQGLKKEGRSRKKSPKAKFKKYKYHEYRPPNGEIQKCNLPMDSPYALMLQQQQLYLQLQVLYQNYPQFVSLPSIPENTAKISNNNINNNNNVDEEKPVKIEDMRVVDMRKELKMRGLPVSGSKTDLIERLKASMSFSNDQGATSSESSTDESIENPGCISSSSYSVPTSSIPTTMLNEHTKLGRSNSLPAHEARLQQVQMQLVANSKKLQTQLPLEVQQQLQHLQYLNLQTQLQQLRVQPQTNIQPKPIQFNIQTSTSQQPVSIANPHPVSSVAAIKKEPSVTDSCVFSKQVPQQAKGPLFTNPPSTIESHTSFFTHNLPTNQPVITMTQATPNQNTNNSNLEQQNSLPGQSQGLLHLKAEASRLNIAASHSEPDLSHMDKIDNSGWNKGMKHFTCENKSISPHGSPHGSPRGSPCQLSSNMFPPVVQHHQEQPSRPTESLEYKPAGVKPDSMQRSYSEHSQEDAGLMMHSMGQDVEKQRSMSEPTNPFAHRRSCSLPSGQLFFDHLNPPPSYEAHMAAQLQRKLSQDYNYQPQQTVPAKTENMDLGMDSQQDRELTQELQRAMMKEDLGLNNDDILEILGASISSSVCSPVHSATTNKVVINSQPAPNQLSPQRFSEVPHLQHLTNFSLKSPSTGFLGINNLPSNNQQFPGRLSKSCEDVTGFSNPNARHGPPSSSDGSLADLDSIILSPASPMRIDSDADHLMSNSIPIPSNHLNRTEPLSWLDLSNSPTMTSPGSASTEVTYINRTSPPPILHGASPSLNTEQFPLSIFELDGNVSHTLSHDFTEAMDFCV